MNFEKLAKWSTDNYSHLPWRVRRSVYGTLVSEIMLQQTTVSTVLNHFDRFIEKYPSIEDLALIDEEQIQVDWKGLGYYRRARNLLKAAKEVSDKFNGEIPREYNDLISIPGIGEYTANAIISIGRNERALPVDANLERVLSRYYGIAEFKGPKLQKEIQSQFKAQMICHDMEKIGSRIFNESLMDLGRSICKAKSAACEICPLSRECKALKEKSPLAYPKLKETKKKESFDLSLLRLICFNKNNEILVYKKSKQQWLSGQYEVPTFTLACSEKNFKQYDSKDFSIETDLLPSFKSAITKYKITNFVLHLSENELSKLGIDKNSYEYIPFSREANLSTASFKSIAI